MRKWFRCPKCKKVMGRDVPRNCIRWASYCESTGKDVIMRKVKDEDRP